MFHIQLPQRRIGIVRVSEYHRLSPSIAVLIDQFERNHRTESRSCNNNSLASLQKPGQCFEQKLLRMPLVHKIVFVKRSAKFMHMSPFKTRRNPVKRGQSCGMVRSSLCFFYKTFLGMLTISTAPRSPQRL